MELENFRTIWRASAEYRLKTAGPSARDEMNKEIRALLNGRSQGLVAKMKRNLFGELILVLAVYAPAILFYLFEFGGKLTELGGTLLALTALFGLYYYRKNKLLNEMQCLSCQIRSNLERQVNTLRKYVRFYTIAGTILVPLMAVWSFLLTTRNLSTSLRGSPFFSLPGAGASGWRDLGIAAIALILATVLAYYTNTWYMNKLYGRHIKKLRQLLEEMDEE